jgi:UDP-N-acetylglucosamine 1-carboxyvinyltransferase
MKAPKGLRGTEIIFDFPSVTATENLMMAATLAKGKTILYNAAREPEVVFLGEMLNRMGARIFGLGTETIVIEGVKELSPVEVSIIPDRIEAGTYLMAPGLAGGEVVLRGVNPHHLETVVAKLREIGLEIDVSEDAIRSRKKRSLKPVEVRTAPYPGFPTDLQAQIMALLSKARGTSVIVETVFEERFRHADELRRMGADIVVEGRVAVVNGVKKLQAAPVVATDLRASASLVLAALGAEGITEIAEITHLKRGYEALTEKLSRVGAKIWEEPCTSV